MREIIKDINGVNSRTIIIHRYNSLDDTFIEYYSIVFPDGVVIYKNTWKYTTLTETYRSVEK